MKRILTLVGLVCLSACGGSGFVPVGSTIEVHPSSIEQSIVGDVCQPISAVVKDSQGRLLVDVRVYVSGAFAYPRTPARYEFHLDANCTSRVSSPFYIETGERGAVFYVRIPAIVGNQQNSFIDRIELRAGDAYATVELRINQ